MIKKLLLIRKAKMKSDMISGTALGALLQGDVLEVCPRFTWTPEDGFSHYGFCFELKLKQLDELKVFVNQNGSFTTLIDVEGFDKETVEKALNHIGLKLYSEE